MRATLFVPNNGWVEKGFGGNSGALFYLVFKKDYLVGSGFGAAVFSCRENVG